MITITLNIPQTVEVTSLLMDRSEPKGRDLSPWNTDGVRSIRLTNLMLRLISHVTEYT